MSLANANRVAFDGNARMGLQSALACLDGHAFSGDGFTSLSASVEALSGQRKQPDMVRFEHVIGQNGAEPGPSFGPHMLRSPWFACSSHVSSVTFLNGGGLRLF